MAIMSRVFTPLRRFVVAAFLMDMCSGAVGIGLQFMGKHLGASPVQLGLIGTCGAAAYTGACLVAGRLSDRFGRKLSLSLATVGAACGWLLMAHASNPFQLMALGAWSMGCMAFFWPAYQAWMAEITVGGRHQLNRNIGMFNVAWTLGLATGPVLTGALWPLGPAAVFGAVIAAGACALLLVLSTPQRVAGGGIVDTTEAYDRAHPLAEPLLRLAWIIGFAACAVVALVFTTFPNLGLTIGYSPLVVGVLVAFVRVGQFLTFVMARLSDRWQNRKWPLAAGPTLAAVGMLAAFVFGIKPVYALAFMLCGGAQAMAFAASQFYALHGRSEGRGRMAGFHEAVVGAGYLSGPLVGGPVAQYFTLRTPLLAAVYVYVAALLVAWAAWPRLVRLLAPQATATRLPSTNIPASP